MNVHRVSLAALAAVFLVSPPAEADVFGTGANQFTIPFVAISGSVNPADTSPSGGYGIVDYDYRMGVYQITNAQWDAFVAEDQGGVPLGTSTWVGSDIPVNRRSWFQAAHFVNWLNTSTGRQAAYQFDSQGDFVPWDPADAWGGTNLYRHQDAFYFLPSEDEWVKAAYFNGTALQSWATPDDSPPVAGTDSNYGQSTPHDGPWAVGSGTGELNGTYDMMGNVFEWLESPYSDSSYGADSARGLRGGSFGSPLSYLAVSDRDHFRLPGWDLHTIGFRVASVIPEPGSAAMLLAGAVAMLLWRRRRGTGP